MNAVVLNKAGQGVEMGGKQGNIVMMAGERLNTHTISKHGLEPESREGVDRG